MNVKKFEVPIYNYPIVLCFGQNQDFIDYCRKTYKQIPGENFDDFAEGYAMQLERVKNGVKELNLVMFIRDKDRFGNTISETVNHEAIHIAWTILEFVGISLNEQNHEALTYLVTFITREVTKNIDKWTK